MGKVVIFLIVFGAVLVVSAKGGRRVKRIVGGEPAAPPPEDEAVIFTRFGGKSARVQGSRDFPHYVFKGIRYAYPPTGKDRFLRPRQYFLNGMENATQYPSPCVQPLPNDNRVIGSEDCLFLNVFTPTLPTGMEGLPVIVWIHGGGFRYGSASQYGVRHLVGKQVIIVTIQYRLGSLGFLSTGSKELPGNAALWDMVLAVQWTRNYIGFFGGNPHRIVVMGHGSGASSAMLVALSNVAKGMPAGVVAMSGSSVSRFAVDDAPKDTAMEVADLNGCPTTDAVTMVKCLQKITPGSIIKGDSNIEFQRIQQRGFVEGLSGRTGAAPVSEGADDRRALPPLVENDPMTDLYLDQSKPKIPLLTGITKDETKRAVYGQYKDEIIKKLTTIPNFLEQTFVSNLQGALGLHKSGNGSRNTEQFRNALNPLQFYNYLKVKRNDLKGGLAKISEATGDALFNVPAFLTAEAWSRFKGAPSFLYQFEHSGRRRKGMAFLQGSPLVGNATNASDEADTVGHGDELAYLFDAQDHEGRPLPEDAPASAEDDRVRDVFTQMVADFARFGHVNINDESVKPFSSNDNNFIQVSAKPKVSNNFRYCQMALWCGLAQRLQSATCSFLKVVDTELKDLQGLFDTVAKPFVPTLPSIRPTFPIKGINNAQHQFQEGLGGLLGGNLNKNPINNNKNRIPSLFHL